MNVRSYFCGIILVSQLPCRAQDLWISPGFEYVNFFGEGYLDSQGLGVGLRFPITDSSSYIDVRLSYVVGKFVEDDYDRRDQRFGASIGYLRSGRLGKSLLIFYGLEAGFYGRRISTDRHALSETRQSLLTVGAQLGVQLIVFRSIQPFLSVHPLYEFPLQTQVVYDNAIEVNTESQSALAWSIGLRIGLWSPPE